MAGEPTPDDEDAGSDENLATVAGKLGASVSSSDAPTRHGSGASTHGASQRGGSTLTADQALAADELQRTRLFLKVSAVLAGTLMAVTPFLSGGAMVRVGVTTCAAVVVAVTLWFARRLRDDRGYSSRLWWAVSSTLIIATCIGIYFIGVFSPAPMVGTLGIYFLCLGSSFAIALSSYLAGAILHAAPALAIAFGLIRDPGLFDAPDATLHDKLIAALMVQIVFGLTFLLARGSRRATRDAIERLHSALLQVQKREALLAEAHLDLDRALRGGFGGRYTDRRLGPFLLGEVIGRGAMSEVYRARHADDGSAAAVKVLRDLGADSGQLRRFLREAHIVSSLKSPHVVRVLHFGNFDGRPGDDAPPYIAMELLCGHDLAWHLRRERRLSQPRLLELVDHVAEAIAEAEAAEIVHRDLKPQNIFCAEPASSEDHADGSGPRIWKVLDFGVSKLTSSTGTLTRGHIVGTPGYMAPEQARGGEVGPRADVFALAVIAYRALTGRPAFSGKDMPRVLFDICYAQPAQPSRMVPVPLDVERALALGMAKRPEERLATTLELAAALQAGFQGALSPELRARADALLERLPWGFRPSR